MQEEKVEIADGEELEAVGIVARDPRTQRRAGEIAAVPWKRFKSGSWKVVLKQTGISVARHVVVADGNPIVDFAVQLVHAGSRYGPLLWDIQTLLIGGISWSTAR